MCCSVLQCVAACSIVLQCVVYEYIRTRACAPVLVYIDVDTLHIQATLVFSSVDTAKRALRICNMAQSQVAACCSVLQCVAVCRSVSQCVAVCRSVFNLLQCFDTAKRALRICNMAQTQVAACSSMLQCIVVRFIVLQ